MFEVDDRFSACPEALSRNKIVNIVKIVISVNLISTCSGRILWSPRVRHHKKYLNHFYYCMLRVNTRKIKSHDWVFGVDRF